MKKKKAYQSFLQSRKMMKRVQEAVLAELSRAPAHNLRSFQERFKISNRKAGELLGVSEGQIENIRSGKSKQTAQTTQLLKLLSKKLHREIRKQARIDLRKADENPINSLEELTALFQSLPEREPDAKSLHRYKQTGSGEL